MDGIKKTQCPFCAEPVKAAAVICPHCRSGLEPVHAAEPFRNRPGKQIAGVSVALAESFDLPVTFVRLSFIILTFVSFLGPIMYAALWVIFPFEAQGHAPLHRLTHGDAGESSIAERLLNWAEDAIAWLRKLFRGQTRTTPSSPSPSNGSDKPIEGAS